MFSTMSYLAFLMMSSVTGGGSLGASAHFIGFGGASSFLRAYAFFACFFFFFLSSPSSSPLGINLPNKILGSL